MIIKIVGIPQKRHAIDIIKNLQYDPISEIIIRESKSSRSLLQNNLLHAWCKDASIFWSESTGKYFSPESFKFLFKDLFLGYESIETIDGVKNQIKQTSKLNTKEFTNFLEKIEYYCGENNIKLTIPNYYGDAVAKT